MKIGILMLRSSATRRGSIISEVIRLLSEWGASVDVMYPEEQLTELSRVRVEHDLYILKSRTDMALSLAGALHAVGAAILNPYPVAAMLRDKIFMNRMLQAAGVPTPDTYVTAHPALLGPLLEEGPLVIKPYRGSGTGVHVVWDVDELDDVPTNRGPVFVQRYQERENSDCKIYSIGAQLFGVRRKWPARTHEEKAGEAVTLTPALRDLATRCGQAFGLEMYGVTVIESNGRAYAVDVSSFPGFKGVPDAALRLADYIYAAGQRAMKGEPLLAAQEKIRREISQCAPS